MDEKIHDQKQSEENHEQQEKKLVKETAERILDANEEIIDPNIGPGDSEIASPYLLDEE